MPVALPPEPFRKPSKPVVERTRAFPVFTTVAFPTIRPRPGAMRYGAPRAETALPQPCRIPSAEARAPTPALAVNVNSMHTPAAPTRTRRSSRDARGRAYTTRLKRDLSPVLFFAPANISSVLAILRISRVSRPHTWRPVGPAAVAPRPTPHRAHSSRSSGYLSLPTYINVGTTAETHATPASQPRQRPLRNRPERAAAGGPVDGTARPAGYSRYTAPYLSIYDVQVKQRLREPLRFRALSDAIRRAPH